MTDHNEQEISNVDLQFQRTRSEEPGRNDELDAEINAENARAGQGEFREQGMDRHDVGVEDTMDASDPPSTNMGQDENDHGEK
ncbi:M-like protein [Deinococcus sp. SL84]|uniref:M-like protein n=1 Tax=Deinococcus sp. SL84 TaxID=2994663 RepID=UPI0022732E39|nr:M-like protein [Deinococcus sp. SL84]MCY1701868.1 M-like protein [Deinococcus sp. SL84]